MPASTPRKEIIFGRAERPILPAVFKQLEDRSSRYVPLLIKLFPTPDTRPRQQEVLIEAYEKAKLAAVSPAPNTSRLRQRALKLPVSFVRWRDSRRALQTPILEQERGGLGGHIFSYDWRLER
jgi:hypothetical protein